MGSSLLPGARPIILLIEPNGDARRAIVAMLEGEPIDLWAVDSPSEGRIMLAEYSPDLIIVDRWALGAGAADVEAVWPNTPILDIGLSAQGESGGVRKPFSGSAIRRAVRAALRSGAR